MLTFATRLMLALLVVLPACGDDGSLTDGLTTAAEDSAADSAEGGDEGAAVLDEETEAKDPTPDQEESPPELLAACDLPTPCEYPVELVRDSKTQSYADSDLCALQAFASGTHGQLIQTVAAFASAESYLDHVIVAPGVVLRQANGRSDGLGLWQKPVERCVIKPLGYFTGCAEAFDAGCLDPDTWVESCEILDDLTCPQA
jgi:hypothetical protein